MNVESFLLQQAQPGLVPGENVLGCALLRHPTRFNVLGVPTVYDDFLAVATERRLVVFRTVTSGLLVSNVAQPVAHDPVVWSYDELAAVELGTVEGIVAHSGGAAVTLTLTALAGFGPVPTGDTSRPTQPVRYDVYAAIENLPGQGAFMRSFPTWLKERFDAGAFALTAARRAELEASIPRLRAAAADEARRLHEERLAGSAKLARFMQRAAAIVVMLGAVGYGGSMAARARRDEAKLEEERDLLALQKKDLAWIRAGGRPPNDCPDRALGATTCHSCEVDGYGLPRPEQRRIEGHPRGTLTCPSASGQEATIAVQSHEVKRAEKVAADSEARTFTGIGIGAAGVVAGVGALVFLARRDRRRGESAPFGGRRGGPVLGAQGVAG